ncbi:hypothetical protein PybrP1_005251 [[Pythium] brassicae (nom. inval.)]|nr:hypothetical protein PybrP1_005251 [[Pythium] brassicae (nom. inval.)]
MSVDRRTSSPDPMRMYQLVCWNCDLEVPVCGTINHGPEPGPRFARQLLRLSRSARRSWRRHSFRSSHRAPAPRLESAQESDSPRLGEK